MAHVDGVSEGFIGVAYSIFKGNIVAKSAASFFSALIFSIMSGNEFLIGCIFLVYIIDMATGTYKAMKLGTFTSRQFFMGATKLITYGIFMVLAVSIGKSLLIGNILLSGVFGFILVTDGISILENLEQLGYNTPTGLKKYLKAYNDKINNNKEE